MLRRERRAQERREKKEKKHSFQKVKTPEILVQSETSPKETLRKEPRFSLVFDWIDIAFQLFFIYQLFQLWITPDPTTAGSLLDSVETLLLLEFSMVPFKIFVIIAGRKYGTIIAFLFYGLLTVMLLSLMKNTTHSFVFILMLLNRMCAICLNKIDKKKALYLAMSIISLIIVLVIQGAFMFFQPSFGLTESFLDSISYRTEFMNAKFQVLFLIEYYIANIALMIIMRHIDWSKTIVIDFKHGTKKQKETRTPEE
ncbi:hypothetical protein [Bacteroides sp. 224]|uniref:hypothetical protein n=1 Tax=Bacteroides sp. 224 TaxID=2302936 RepID=UPI0013D033E5|nr:hypothetical protein [Bacteroides sp. 224]NDV65708.1 hypothetical protein [Bacteroides sp. 224]